MSLPRRSRPADEVLAELDALKQHDVRWKDGRAFTLAYYAGPDIAALGDEAYRRFSSDNALNTDAFPSLRRIQSDVVAMTSDLLDGGPEAAGFMTTGGTESLLMAVKAARERGRAERGVTEPEMVLPESAHAAFHKAAHYFGVRARKIPVRDDWRADVDAMADAIDDDTVLVVGSAPQYPQGVIDPIENIASLAAERDINCHVDACMGGMVLPYLARLGEEIAPWNFTVPGVTSISVDLHKFGYTSKGASVIVHRNRELRSHQTFVTSNWLGGTYGSSGVLGTKGGGAMAAAWAVMNHLGDDGYLRLTDQARRATLELAAAIEACPDLELRARPDAMIVAFGAADAGRLDVFALADELWRRGWYIDRQQPPDSLHCTVNAVHDGLIAGFVAELNAAIDDVVGAAAAGTAGSYGTLE
jgi:glutamate/tyrosine decarboxylase-like PLP-dependent enzyme